MTPGALAAAGALVRGAVDDEVRAGLDGVVTAVRAIAVALPGTRSAGLAEELARRWEGVGADWAAALRAHGEALTAAAAAFEAADHAAATATPWFRTNAPFVRQEGTNGAFVRHGGGPSTGAGAGAGSGGSP